MFNKFGEFDSVEELNRAAEGLKNEGDTESIYVLATENGIDRDDVSEYIDGYAPELASLYMAAVGRIDVQEAENEKEDLMTRMALKTITMTLKGMIQEDAMAAAVMRKGKRVKDIYDAMRQDASKNKSGNMAVVCGTDEDLRNIIRAYFMEGKDAAVACIANLRK